MTTSGTGTDVTVKQIATAYEIRGMMQTITSYDSATQNSGTVLNQVQLTYNTFGQLISEQQDHAANVSSSTPSVQYGYDSGASSSNEIRPNALTYPNGRVVNFNFTNTLDAALNRITSISDTSATLASYNYTGGGMVVRINYPQPSIWLDLWGGTSGTFNGLDPFNRIIDQRWQNSVTTTTADIDRYQYGYDYNSNRLYKANVVGTAAVGGLDEGYDYDNLNRLTQMQRGNLSSGVITGTPTREMDYTLDPTGNWSAYLTKTNGTTDLSQTRTANKVNEITAIGGTPGWATPPTYDSAGNMTSFPQPATPASSFTATYDAWNRMVSISSGGSIVATYQYDGRGRRIGKYTTSITETRHFFYTNDWQNIQECVGTTTNMDTQYVWGVRYIDELVRRDDATPQRLYAMQDANFNLTSICSANGTVEERYLFDPYGSRTLLNIAWRVISASGYNWVIGHQGLMHDEECGLVYNRARYLSPMLGRFCQRDALVYLDGPNLMSVEVSNPISKMDADGNKSFDPVGLKPGHGRFQVKLDPNLKNYLNGTQQNQASHAQHVRGYDVEYDTNGTCTCGGDTPVLNQAIDTTNIGGKTDHWDWPSTVTAPNTNVPPTGYINMGGATMIAPTIYNVPGYFDAPGYSTNRHGIVHVEVCAMCKNTGLVLGCTTFDWDTGKDDFILPAGWVGVGDGSFRNNAGLIGSIAKNASNSW